MAAEFSVREGVIPEELQDGWHKLSSQQLATFAREGGLNLAQLKRGDGVRFADIGDYRNDGLVLWDGQQLVQLAFDIDEYGALPASFPINDFPTTTHFQDLITHNSIVYFANQGIDLDESLVTNVSGRVRRIEIIQAGKVYHLYTPDVRALLLRWKNSNPILLSYHEETGVWINPDVGNEQISLYDSVGFGIADEEGCDLGVGSFRR